MLSLAGTSPKTLYCLDRESLRLRHFHAVSLLAAMAVNGCKVLAWYGVHEGCSAAVMVSFWQLQ
jgi:hypothetical protein